MWLKLKRWVAGLADGHSVEIVRKAKDSLVFRILGTGFLFAFSSLVARSLGSEEAGLFFLSQNLVFLAIAVGRGGLANAVLRFVSEAAAAGDWAKVRAVFKKGFLFSFAWASVVASTLWLFAPFLARHIFHKPDLESPLRWIAVTVVPGVLMVFTGEALKGLKRIKQATTVNGVVVPLASLVILALIRDRWGAQGAVLAFLAANFLAVLAGAFLWQSALPRPPTLRKSDFETRKLLASSVPLFHLIIGSMILERSPALLLGIWGTKADVGVFDMAFRTATLTAFALLAMNSIIPAKIAEIYHNGDMELLDQTIRRMARLTALLASPMVLCFLLFPFRIMSFFGEEFARGGPILAILALGQFVNAAVGSVGYVLIMTGHEALLRNIIMVTTASTILLGCIVIPFWGVVGAACVSASGSIIQNLVASFVVMRRLGIRTIPWPLFLRPSSFHQAEQPRHGQPPATGN